MKHYAAINRDGFQGNAFGATPAQALETIIRDSSGPADYTLSEVHPCTVTARTPDTMTLYGVPDDWDGGTAEDVQREGAFVGHFTCVWCE
jgi:hypothetical protein